MKTEHSSEVFSTLLNVSLSKPKKLNLLVTQTFVKFLFSKFEYAVTKAKGAGRVDVIIINQNT